MYVYPEKAAFGKTLAKALIYRQARATKRIKELFVSQIQEIVWAYKLSPDTVNLPPKGGYREIQIFEIHLRTVELAPSVLTTIDKAIPYPIIFRLRHKGQVKVISAYKRPATDGTKKWVVGGRFDTEWIAEASSAIPLPIALNMKSLYEQMMQPIVGSHARNEESFADMIRRLDLVRQKERELKTLETRLKKERQFNRKVEVNAEIREHVADLEKIR
jgi:hypothetical protein